MKKRSRKLIAAVMTLAMLLSCMAFPAAAFGAETTATVTVIANPVAKEAPEVITLEVSSDDYVGAGDTADTPGLVTIADVITAFHKTSPNYSESDFTVAFYDGGTWSALSITKLLGDTSGLFNYYHNNISAGGLNEEVKDGDSVTMFIGARPYPDTDTYYYLAPITSVIDEGQDLTLTLNRAGYDAEWNPVTFPGTDRTVILTDADGKTAEAKTDADGKAVFKDLAAGTYTASIKSKGANDYFVMPWAQVTVNAVEDNSIEDDAVAAPEDTEKSKKDDGKGHKMGSESGLMVLFVMTLAAVGITSGTMMMRRRTDK